MSKPEQGHRKEGVGAMGDGVGCYGFGGLETCCKKIDFSVYCRSFSTVCMARKDE